MQVGTWYKCNLYIREIGTNSSAVSVFQRKKRKIRIESKKLDPNKRYSLCSEKNSIPILSRNHAEII